MRRENFGQQLRHIRGIAHLSYVMAICGLGVILAMWSSKAALSHTIPSDDVKVQAQVGADAALAQLQNELSKPFDPSNPFRQEGVFSQTGELLMRMGKYEEAASFYLSGILTNGAALNTEQIAKARVGFGLAAFMTGREDEALAALEDAGPYRTPLASYYGGLVLEKRGYLASAILMYREARQGSNKWFSEPAFRGARLLLEQGDRQQAMEWMVQLSPAIGRTAMMTRLTGDQHMKPLLNELTSSGRIKELENQRALTDRDSSVVVPISSGKRGTRQRISAQHREGVQQEIDRIRGSAGIGTTSSSNNSKMSYIALPLLDDRRGTKTRASGGDEATSPTPQQIRASAIEQSITLEESIAFLKEQLGESTLSAPDRADFTNLLALQRERLEEVQLKARALNVLDTEVAAARQRISAKKRDAVTELSRVRR